MSKNILNRLQEASGEVQRTWIITETLLNVYPTEVKEAAIAAAIPHWFNAAILAALLQIGSSDAERLYQEVQAISFTEPFGEAGYTLHDLTRAAIISHLTVAQPDLFRTYSQRVYEYFRQFDDPQNVVEAVYHLLATDKAAGMELFRKQMRIYRQKRNLSATDNLLRNTRELVELGLLAVVAPRTPAEKTMADIWSWVLKLDHIGVHDNFFDLGGHSLLAIRLISEVEKLFNVKIPLWKLFENPTIAGLVRSMKEEQWQGLSMAVLDTQGVDGRAEATLDDTIHPDNVAPPCSVTDYEHIFLTGATGFLGAFLLYELLHQTRADIHCLVRSSDVEEGRKRICDNLERYLLGHEHLNSRIIPVPGDLSQPRLELSSEQFDMLAHQIDVIYHSGAMVNFLYPYSTLKPVNVLGTQEILRLASLSKVKSVHYVSTVAVFPLVDDDRTESILEDTPLEHFEKLKIGYFQSKWVAEKLVAIAHSRGIPVSVYRPSRITGHSYTGAWNTDDFACRMIKGCIQMGIAPQQPIAGENWVPVDYVSQAIVHLSQQQTSWGSWGQVFHLVNRNPIDWSNLVDWICAFGYPLRKISYERWRKEFYERAAENALSPLMPLFREPDTLAEPQHFSYWNTLAGLEGTSITCPPVDTVLLHTYFAYFLRSRFLDPPQGRK